MFIKHGLFLSYFHSGSPSIYKNEINTMEFVENNTSSDKTVFVFNSGQWNSLYPSISIFTDRDMYLSGQGILLRHNVLFEYRLGVKNEILATRNEKNLVAILKKEKN